MKILDEMMAYYDERAPEYELLYQGKGPVKLDPAQYRKETALLCKIVSKFGRGHLVDIGCGTCFWLPLYAKRCKKVTLLDNSSRMLLECERKLNVLHLKTKCSLIQGDFFSAALPVETYGSALGAFFLSHVPHAQEEAFFTKLQTMLKPNAHFLLIDSTWNEKRQRYCMKEGFQKRTLTNGKTYTIYKRYFNKQDIECLKRTYRIKLETVHFGDVFFAARGEFHA
jgi:cyclopropane fatty-acyl-phospholipid synthase-like methyltransferase